MRFSNLLLLAACAAVSACNMAMSDKPMFAEAERSSALVLEDGLWFRVDPDCDVDVAGPKDKWPECADWVIISGSKAVKSSDTKSADEEPQDVFIADGMPPLIQAKIEANGSPSGYGFLAFEPKGHSPAGRITDLEAWPVACGAEAGEAGTTAKITPYPGFSDECRAESVQALRSAAGKGRSPSAELAEWKWVRAEAQ